MTAAVQIDIVVESAQWREGDEAIVRHAIEAAASVRNKDLDSSALSVLLTDDAAIRRLNAQWRNIDKATNVLSFPSAPGIKVDGEPQSLGDIAIARETTAREAQDEGKPFADHLAHLAVHGFLHLVGYDHDTNGEADEMEQLERVILKQLGVPDPYGASPLLAQDIQG